VLRVIDNPPNPWQSHHVDWLGAPPKLTLDLFEDNSRSILSKNDSPDLGFDWSVNPYRGCYHGCAYCYARPSHQYLDLGAGTDFERKLLIKLDAPSLLREAFMARRWKGEVIALSGNTDCYQPLEASYGLTRGCLEVCREFANPVSIITKGTLIERDIELLQDLHQRAHCTVMISVPFFDAEHARAIEPYVPSPSRRIETIAKLAAAGIPTGVMVAPIIPGLGDSDIPKILRAARTAGARFAGATLLRLPGPVADVFEQRLRAALPLRADRVMHQLEACRGGRKNDARFGHRMRGSGARWDAIQTLFANTRDKLGFESSLPPPDPSPFERPSTQMGFDFC